MRRLLAVGAVLIAFLATGASAVDTFAVHVVSQNSSTITLGWSPQPGYGYLFSADGVLRSRTNDPNRSSVQFSKQYSSFDIDVITKGANGHYPTAPPPPPKAQCEDGVDNDGDGKIDLADPGCSSATDNDETNVVIPPPGCANTTPNVPDGPDGNGGCFPGPSNTGPNAPKSSMSVYTGPCNINTPNVTIDSKVINCEIGVGANAGGLVISNSYMAGMIDNDGAGDVPSFTLRDVLMDNTVNGFACNDCGVQGGHFTIIRTEITGNNRGLWCKNTCEVRDSYIHTAENLNPAQGLHAGGVRMEQFGNFVHNSIHCAYTNTNPSNPETGCSADVTGYPDFVPIHHNTFDSNLFMSNTFTVGFCAYGGGSGGKPYTNDPQNATYIVFRNNVFQRGSNGKCGVFGPITDYKTGRTGNVWSNNKFDNGTVVNPA